MSFAHASLLIRDQSSVKHNPFARWMDFHPISRPSRVDAVGSNHDVGIDRRAVRKAQAHATIGFAGPRQAMPQVERAFRLSVGEQLQKFCSINIIALDTCRGGVVVAWMNSPVDVRITRPVIGQPIFSI